MISTDQGFTGCFHYIWRRSTDFQTVVESFCLMVRICCRLCSAIYKLVKLILFIDYKKVSS